MIVTKLSCFAFLTYGNKAFFECPNPTRAKFKLLGGKARHKEINHPNLNTVLDHWAAGHDLGGTALAGFLHDANTCVTRELHEEAGIDISPFAVRAMANVYFPGEGHLVNVRHVDMDTNHTATILTNRTVDIHTAPIDAWRDNSAFLNKKHTAIVNALFTQNANPSALVVMGAQLEPLFF